MTKEEFNVNYAHQLALQILQKVAFIPWTRAQLQISTLEIEYLLQFQLIHIYDVLSNKETRYQVSA